MEGILEVRAAVRMRHEPSEAHVIIICRMNVAAPAASAERK